MIDPFSLKVCVGKEGYSKHHWSIGALRGAPEAQDRYGEFTILMPLGRIVTFYIGEYYDIKRVGITLQYAHFWIVAGNPNAEPQRLGDNHYIEGCFDILAEGDGKTRALRLLKWWVEWEPTIPRRREMALHLGRMIKVRGMKEPGAMFKPGPHDIEIDEYTVPLNEWAIEIGD